MKNHRNGGKFGGSHTTYIDLAGQMADIANDLPEVTRIFAGYINTGTGGTGGRQRVKICDTSSGVLLACSQNTSVQEVRIVTQNPHATKLAIAKRARDMGADIRFGP